MTKHSKGASFSSSSSSSDPATRSVGVLEYCAKSELHPRSGLGMLMAENGVIFSDGIESDFLQFNSGPIAAIQPANRKGVLDVG